MADAALSRPAIGAPTSAAADRWSVWRAPILAWAISRAIVIGTGIIGSVWLGWQGPPVDPSVPRSTVLLGAWDTGWYFDIARNGYHANTPAVGHEFTNLAFFPLLPGILRAGLATPVNPFIWGLVICNLAFLGGLVAFHAISRDRAGLRFADWSTWALALSPPAVYASLVYTDGLILALAAGAGLAAIRGRWLLAGLCGAAAALLRPPGLLVAVLVVLIAVLASDTPLMLRVRNAVVGGVPAVVALAAFLGWMQIARGSWSLPSKAEAAWGRPSPGFGILTSLWRSSYSIVVRPYDHPFQTVYAGVAWAADARDLLLTIVAVVLLIALWWSGGTWRNPWAIFATLAVIVPLAGGGVGSMTRYLLLAFPLIWPVAGWLVRGGARRAMWTGCLAIVVMIGLVLQLHYYHP